MDSSDSSSMESSPTVNSSSDSEQSLKCMASTGGLKDMSTIRTQKTRKRIPTDQWEAKRPIITQLYQTERRPLKEVMDILEKDFGFKATVKMYKSRIWKWGLDKKLKSDEVLAILRLKLERDAKGKKSDFTIRGQPVDMVNINRYVKRNPILLARLRTGHLPCAQTIHEVSCFTPPPSPIRSLRPPGEFDRVDQVLRLFRDYMDGSFAGFAWDWQYDVSCTGRVLGDRSEELFERVMASFALANRCMIKGDKVSLEGLLNPAFESLREIVASGSPIFATRAVCFLWYLERHHKNDLLRLVMTYLSNLISIVLGPHHVLSAIWHILGSFHFSDYHELSMCLYSMIIPLMEQRIGPANYLTTIIYGDHIDCLIQSNQTSQSLTLATHYRAKVEATGQRHPWLLEMAITQTAVLCANKESEGLIDEAMNCLQTLKAYPLTIEQQAMVDIQMGNYAYRLNHFSSAIASYRNAARLLLASGGCDERLLVTCLTNLETCLDRQCYIDDANRVREYRLKRVADFAADTSDYAKGLHMEEFPDLNSVPESTESLSTTTPETSPTTAAATAASIVHGNYSDDFWLWGESDTSTGSCSVDTILEEPPHTSSTAIEPETQWIGAMPAMTECWGGGEGLIGPAITTSPDDGYNPYSHTVVTAPEPVASGPLVANNVLVGHDMRVWESQGDVYR